ncbi:MAG TPA: ABC transporter permease [Caulobacteraceae bacterium]
MLRNYLSAALGNLGRNGPYAGITILGLAISFAAAILIGLYVRDEFSFDRFIPGHERVYRMQDDLLLPGQKPRPTDVVQSTAAANLKLDFPEVERVARLANAASQLKLGDRVTGEPIDWVDPDFFKVMPFPVLAGDLNAAVAEPDGLVLTREAARKYFGQDAPIGRVLLVDSGLEGRLGLPPAEMKRVSGFHPMKVMAVLADLPASSHLDEKVFAAGLAPFSPIAVEDRHPTPTTEDLAVYVKLKSGASPAGWEARFSAFAQRHYRAPGGGQVMNRYWLARLDELHFTPSEGEAVGDRRVDFAIAAVGALIVSIAAINFVTLMTARATRRAVEVGVRKAVGARRRDLVSQFMGEALIYMVIAMVIAVVAAELVLPSVDAFLGRALRFDYLADPALAGALIGAALLTTALAGLYPAVVLSAFRPVAALKGGAGQSTGSVALRHALVIAQFSILIGLIVMTATIYRQTRFVLNDALRVNTDQVARIFTPCGSAFGKEARRLPGVQAAACASSKAMMQFDTGATGVQMADGSLRIIYVAQLGPGFFEVHGLKPAAGRFFSRAHGEDMVLDRPDPPIEAQPSVVLNETAARFLGYADPHAAVGKTVIWARWSPALADDRPPPNRPSQIVGVVPDFTLGTARTAIRPTLFFVDPNLSTFLVLKLDHGRIPETLEALRRLWRQTGHDRPASIVFEAQSIQALYKDVITQGVALAVCAGLAIVIACLGLFALAAFVTERRTKEIGVRKAMGASSVDVARLLLWQFTQPVLWANLVAWPAAFLAMSYWLDGFAYRVGQPVWLFMGATAAAAVIAWITVSFQSWMAARANPASALRCE